MQRNSKTLRNMEKRFEKAAGLLATAVMLAAGFNYAAAQQITVDLSRYASPTATKILRQLAAEEDASKPYSVNMTINGDPRTQLGFTWFTNPGVEAGEVQIVKGWQPATEEDFEIPDYSFAAEATPVIDLNYSIDKNQLEGVTPGEKRSYLSHKALATGLAMGMYYSFRVGSEEGWSEIGTFKTASYNYQSGYDFIYITDTQAQNDEMFNVSQKTVHAAVRKVPDAAFVLVNGDLVETSGSNNSEWENEQWFSTMQDVWMNYPLVPIQGNHDTSSNHNWAWHFNTDRSFNQTSAVPTDMEGTVYSFVQGGVLYMVINYEDWKKPGYFDALSDWMRQQVAENPDTRWRLASFHKNMFTGSKSHQSDADGRTVREAMCPVFEELGIDVALQGHDHIYEVIGPVTLSDKTLIADEVEMVEEVEGGVRENMTGKEGGQFNVAQGTLFFLNNSAGKKKYEPRNEQEMIAALADHGVENYWGLFSGKFGQTGEPTFSHVHVETDSLTFTTYTVDDLGNPSLFDSFTVVKDPTQTSIDAHEITSGPVKAIFHRDTRTIEVKGLENASISLYSIDGHSIVASASSICSVAGLPGGVYVVKATRQSKNYYSKVLIE